MTKKKLALISLSLGLGFQLLLSTVPAMAQPVLGQDRKVVDIAKGKKYRNGAEEGELQIQPQLTSPQRKISPVIVKDLEEEKSEERD